MISGQNVLTEEWMQNAKLCSSLDHYSLRTFLFSACIGIAV